MISSHSWGSSPTRANRRNSKAQIKDTISHATVVAQTQQLLNSRAFHVLIGAYHVTIPKPNTKTGIKMTGLAIGQRKERVQI